MRLLSTRTSNTYLLPNSPSDARIAIKRLTDKKVKKALKAKANRTKFMTGIAVSSMRRNIEGTLAWIPPIVDVEHVAIMNESKFVGKSLHVPWECLAYCVCYMLSSIDIKSLSPTSKNAALALELWATKIWFAMLPEQAVDEIAAWQIGLLKGHEPDIDVKWSWESTRLTMSRVLYHVAETYPKQFNLEEGIIRLGSYVLYDMNEGKALSEPEPEPEVETEPDPTPILKEDAVEYPVYYYTKLRKEERADIDREVSEGKECIRVLKNRTFVPADSDVVCLHVCRGRLAWELADDLFICDDIDALSAVHIVTNKTLALKIIRNKIGVRSARQDDSYFARILHAGEWEDRVIDKILECL